MHLACVPPLPGGWGEGRGRYLRKAKSPSAWDREAALARLSDGLDRDTIEARRWRRRAERTLINVLQQKEHWDLKDSAAFYLRRIPLTKAGAGDLINLLKSGPGPCTNKWQQDALEALARAGDRRAFDIFASLLRRDVSTAVNGLTRIGDHRAVPLIRAAVREAPSFKVKLELIDALDKFIQLDDVVQGLIDALVSTEGSGLSCTDEAKILGDSYSDKVRWSALNRLMYGPPQDCKGKASER